MQLVSTWQVIVVTVVLVLFIFLINYVSRPHHKPLFVSKAKPQKAKPQKTKAAGKPEKPVKKEKKKSPAETINDELGLEE